MDDLKTYAENTWCPGCGNFGILTAFNRAVTKLETVGITKENLIISAGIGCHAKIFDYLALSGFYSLHGRSMATIQGIKLANPELKVVTFVGDGDALGEGLEHVLFAAKRNADITIIVHDNGVYGLTTGQFTPTSARGFIGKSTPSGSVEDPLNPLVLALEAGATFVARGYSGKIDQLSEIIARAVKHEGFAYVHVLQPCVSFNDTYKSYNSLVEILDHTPSTLDDALLQARRTDRLPIGIFYSSDDKLPFHNALYGNWNPFRNRIPHKDRTAAVEKLINSTIT